MSTRFTRIAALALPLLLATACADDEPDADELGTDATMPADSPMYTPPPPPVTDTGMMGTDTMGADTMRPDTTGGM